jgi:hypothetical protein
LADEGKTTQSIIIENDLSKSGNWNYSERISTRLDRNIIVIQNHVICCCFTQNVFRVSAMDAISQKCLLTSNVGCIEWGYRRY